MNRLYLASVSAHIFSINGIVTTLIMYDSKTSTEMSFFSNIKNTYFIQTTLWKIALEQQFAAFLRNFNSSKIDKNFILH